MTFVGVLLRQHLEEDASGGLAWSAIAPLGDRKQFGRRGKPMTGAVMRRSASCNRPSRTPDGVVADVRQPDSRGPARVRLITPAAICAGGASPIAGLRRRRERRTVPESPAPRDLRSLRMTMAPRLRYRSLENSLDAASTVRRHHRVCPGQRLAQDAQVDLVRRPTRRLPRFRSQRSDQGESVRQGPSANEPEGRPENGEGPLRSLRKGL